MYRIKCQKINCECNYSYLWFITRKWYISSDMTKKQLTLMLKHNINIFKKSTKIILLIAEREGE